MVRESPLTWAREHPSPTFGVAGGLAAIGFFVLVFVPPRLAGETFDVSLSVVTLVVVGGVLGGALVSRVLWARLGGSESPLRGALVGALVGLLAMPVPMYLIEFGIVAFEGGVPFDPQPGASPLVSAARNLFLLAVMPLVLSLFGLFVTRGGTVVVGAVTGYLLARR